MLWMDHGNRHFNGGGARLGSYRSSTMPALRADSFARLPRGRVPVFLLGGINLARAFGLAGIPVVVAGKDLEDPAFESRYCPVRIVLPSDAENALTTIEEAGAALRKIYSRRIPLAYGNDDWLRFIYTHRDRLRQSFALLLNDASVGEALLDKRRFAEFSREHGLPVPASLRWDELARFDRPVIAKPAHKLDWSSSPVLTTLLGGEGKALVRESGATAFNDAAIARFHHQLVFQEYVPGDDADQWC